VIRLEIRLHKVLRGGKAPTLEDSITLIEHDIKGLKQFRSEMTEYLAAVEKRLVRSIQGVSTVRFNPFKGEGTGGNQSFATSFLSEKGDGLILSSLYSRDRVSIFAKPVNHYKSEYELTNEEKDSLKKAREITSQKQ
ncbi:MAG: DUF4446 family protein, partial [Candidatus Taylorbacteria bacterium]|nr:DUF4446 family protein [Candidatus Taylorbacteria bacterium]